MWLWLAPLAFAFGVIVGRFSVRRYRHDCVAWAQRRLIAWLRLYFPWLTRFMRFSPGTYIRWLQAKSRKGHAMKIAEGRGRRANARLGKKSPAG